MKALIQKELRENVKVAAIGFAGFAILTLGSWRYYAALIGEVARGTSDAAGYWNRLQPLASSIFLNQTAVVCAVFGALLGWLQIHHERHRDLWAFLVHRPVTRTRLFAGKVTAGLLIYTAVAGVPLLLFVLWASARGNVPAPFEWSMALPVLQLFLAGIGAYFAGMLTGLRQARWYGSRGLGLGLGALVVFWAVMGVWREMAVGGAILAAAAWGSFLGGGGYRMQPAWGKAALTLTLGVGSFVVVVVVAGLLMIAAFQSQWSSQSFQYVMTKDGTIYRETYRQGVTVETVGLDGNLLLNADTGQPMTTEEMARQRSEGFFADVNFENRRRAFIVEDSNGYFFFHGATRDTLWYYWKKTGRLTGYNTKSGKLIGSIGPEGFATTAEGDGSRFRDYYGVYNRGVAQVMFALVGTETALYEAHPDYRSVREIFKTTPDDPIGGAGLQYTGGRSLALAVTRQFVYVLRPDGRPGTTKQWKVPYQPGYPDYSHVEVSLIEKPERFAIWFAPHAWINSPLKRHVVWLAEDGSVAKSADLPPLPETINENRSSDMLNGLLLPPVIHVGTSIVEHRRWPAGISLRLLRTSLFIGVICAAAGWWVGRRNSFSARSQTIWGLFNLLCGLPGLIAFVCANEWPAREECPNCRKLRVVDREHCEHCGAEFAPPAKNGTEIFEPLAAN